MAGDPTLMLSEQQKRPVQEAITKVRHEHCSLHADPILRNIFEDPRNGMVKHTEGRYALDVTMTAIRKEAKDIGGLEIKQVSHDPGSVEGTLGMKHCDTRSQG
jgi:hypothetical protein